MISDQLGPTLALLLWRCVLWIVLEHKIATKSVLAQMWALWARPGSALSAAPWDPGWQEVRGQDAGARETHQSWGQKSLPRRLC